MNISQGLKEKNRIAGRIAKLQSQIQQNNTYVEGKAPDFNSLELLKKLEEEWAFLIELKSKLAKAKVGIAEKLIRLAEAKAALAFWDKTILFSGPSQEKNIVSVRKGSSYEDVEQITVSTISSKEVAAKQAECQKLIESCQDEIDNYNATTII